MLWEYHSTVSTCLLSRSHRSLASSWTSVDEKCSPLDRAITVLISFNLFCSQGWKIPKAWASGGWMPFLEVQVAWVPMKCHGATYLARLSPRMFWLWLQFQLKEGEVLAMELWNRNGEFKKWCNYNYRAQFTTCCFSLLFLLGKSGLWLSRPFSKVKPCAWETNEVPVAQCNWDCCVGWLFGRGQEHFRALWGGLLAE